MWVPLDASPGFLRARVGQETGDSAQTKRYEAFQSRDLRRLSGRARALRWIVEFASPRVALPLKSALQLPAGPVPTGLFCGQVIGRWEPALQSTPKPLIRRTTDEVQLII